MEKPRRKWQQSLKVILLFVALLAIVFAIWIPREKPPNWQTLSELYQGHLIPGRMIVGESISKQFQVIGSARVSTVSEENDLHPSVYTFFHAGNVYNLTDLKLESEQRYIVYLVVVRGEKSPQWIVFETD